MYRISRTRYVNLNTVRVKQNTRVKTPSDVCSLLAKQISSDLVGQCPSSLITNFEQIIKY